MAATLVLVPTNEATGNDFDVTIFAEDDSSKQNNDPRDRPNWNPPAFAASSTSRSLNFRLSKLPNPTAVTVVLQDLSEVSPSVNQTVTSGGATVTFLKDPGQTCQHFPAGHLYHLNGQPDACMLFSATVSQPGDVSHVLYSDTYYYWTMGDNVTPANDDGSGNDSSVIAIVMSGSDPAHWHDWNPPSFLATSPRDLTFTVNTKLDSTDKVQIILKNLCQPGSSQTLSGEPGSAKVVFPQITDPSTVTGPWTQYTDTNPTAVIPYHLEGRADSCSLFEATVKVLDKGNNTLATYYFYYWTTGLGVTP